MTKLTKREATKRFLKGENIVLCASKMHPNGMWNTGITISIDNYDDDDISYTSELDYFNKRIDSYSYYNCTKETGLKVSYYIAD